MSINISKNGLAISGTKIFRCGIFAFDSPIGKEKVDLKELVKDAGERGFGGLDLRVLV